jgi:predicted transcriptional regulator
MPIASAKRSTIKSQAIRLLRRLPAKASWDDVMYRIYVRQKIDAGLADLAAGRTHSHASIRKEFGVT